jgi:hypothetical protein
MGAPDSGGKPRDTQARDGAIVQLGAEELFAAMRGRVALFVRPRNI